MGAPSRVNLYFTKFLGFGVAFDTFPYSLNISLVMPFITIDIGFGESYTDEK
jgi:hypothetical protein